ncbi:MAG: Gfo/Idh/MocA family oxidoreductase [Oscillospiraceae bacterium]|nr:Gfo/Idh/MocA family oxidoreductase [Oscillospiraceae bacterium]
MRKIQWGVLGTAGIARGHTIPGMLEAENCALCAVAGRSLEKAQDFQREFGFARAYGSYDELLADPEVEAVYIPLPNQLHYEWTLKALRAGKHVLCEKPLVPTAAQAEVLLAVARERGVVLMEAFAYLHSPFVAAVKAELDRGAIGEILYMESAFVTSDYDAANIRMRRETLGGSTYDLGCYTVSQILWMLGKAPSQVQAAADISPLGVDAYTAGVMRFADGVRASFQCGMVLATGEDKRIDRFQIHGTRGVLRSETEFNQKGELRYTIESDGRTETKSVYAPDNYRLEIEQMGRCIAEGEKPHVSNAFSLRVAQTLEEIIGQIPY